MDCNNYSYSNSNGRSNTIAEVETETGNRIYFTMESNYFGEHFYFVADIFGEIETKEFEFSSIDETGESERRAYEAAAKYYNGFMSEENSIPMF